jgi:flagellar hook protein FlgE
MLSSLSSGLSGLDNFQEQMNVIGNNIANINTTGFKDGEVSFADTFCNTIQGGSSTLPAMQVGTGVEITATGSNWTQGSLTSTGVTSNLAVSGAGFFTVVDPTTGSSYVTQDGSFTVNSADQLVTANGDIVQGYNSSSLSTIGNLTINTTGSTSTSPISSYAISKQGQITVTQSDGTNFVCGQVLLQNFQDPNMLTNVGNNLYSNMANAGPTTPTAVAPGSNGLGTIESGELEGSNVDLSTEMTNLITAQRAFEANSKIITTSNELLQTVVNLQQG